MPKVFGEPAVLEHVDGQLRELRVREAEPQLPQHLSFRTVVTGVRVHPDAVAHKVSKRRVRVVQDVPPLIPSRCSNFTFIVLSTVATRSASHPNRSRDRPIRVDARPPSRQPTAEIPSTSTRYQVSFSHEVGWSASL